MCVWTLSAPGYSGEGHITICPNPTNMPRTYVQDFFASAQNKSWRDINRHAQTETVSWLGYKATSTRDLDLVLDDNKRKSGRSKSHVRTSKWDSTHLWVPRVSTKDGHVSIVSTNMRCVAVGTWVEETMALNKALQHVPNPRLGPTQPGIGAHIPPPQLSRVLDSLRVTTEPLPHGGQSERVGDKVGAASALRGAPSRPGSLGRLAWPPAALPLQPDKLHLPLARLQHLQRPLSPLRRPIVRPSLNSRTFLLTAPGRISKNPPSCPDPTTSSAPG